MYNAHLTKKKKVEERLTEYTTDDDFKRLEIIYYCVPVKCATVKSFYNTSSVDLAKG